MYELALQYGLMNGSEKKQASEPDLPISISQLHSARQVRVYTGALHRDTLHV